MKRLPRRPTIDVLYHYAYPDDVVSARHFDGLCSGLAARGWDVRIYPCNRSCRDERLTYVPHGHHAGVDIRRVWRPRFRQASTLGRLLNSAWMIAAWSFLSGRPRADIMLVGTDPSFSALTAIAWHCLSPRTRLAHWCFDLYPEAAVADGHLRAGSWPDRLLRSFMRGAYRCCRLLIDLGPCMRQQLRAYHPTARQLTIVPWALSEPAAPSAADPKIRQELFGSGRLGLLYSGNFGRAHSHAEFLQLARSLRDDDVQFSFAVRGNRADELRQAVTANDRNVHVAGFAPEAELEARLAAADIHLVSLRREWAGVVVPSKFFGSLAAGRPVIYAGPDESAVAHWIRELRVGWVLRPDNVANLAGELRQLAAAPERLAQLQQHCHRAYHDHFCYRRMLDAWDHELRALLHGTSLRPHEPAN
jgi:glycosyltransferase involved in cell wall biosynthesis